MLILALHGGQGSNVRWLGIPFDHALSTKDAVLEMVGQATWKMAAILRTGKNFTDGELANLYKSQLISYLECRTAATYHACNTVLAPLDSVQEKFLSELGRSDADALCHFNLAPLKGRRGVAMLGLIHRCALGKSSTSRRSFKHLRTWNDQHEVHARDMEDRSLTSRIATFSKSNVEALWDWYGYTIGCRKILWAKSAWKKIQRHLQLCLKDQLLSERSNWKHIFVLVYINPMLWIFYITEFAFARNLALPS